MSRTVTLLELRTRAIDAADFKQLNDNQFATNAQVNAMINDSGSELFDLLIVRWADYFIKTSTITLLSNVTAYNLPVDFHKSRGVYFLQGSIRNDMRPFDESERADLFNAAGNPYAYKIEAGQIIIPPPSSVGTVELRYIYQFPYLTADTDALDLNVVSGWEQYIVYDVAYKLRMKARDNPADIQSVQMARDAVRERIKVAANERQQGGGNRMRDTYGMSVMRYRAPVYLP